MWCVGPVIVVHISAIIVGIVIGQVARPSVSWWVIVAGVTVQCLTLVWFTALGSAIGRFTPPLLAGVVAGTVSFVLGLMLGDGGSTKEFQLLAVGAATISRIGYTYNLGYLAGQAVVLSSTAALLTLLPIRNRSGLRVPSALGTAAGGAVAAAVILSSVLLPSQRLLAEPRPPDYCVGSKPQVCLYAEHKRFAGPVQTRIQELSRFALRAGCDGFVPDRVVESSRTYVAGGPGVASITIWQEAYETGQLPPEAVPSELLTPSHCAQLTAPEPPSAEFDTRYFSLLATWMSLAGEKLEHSPVPYRLLDAAQVRQIVDEFARCNLDGRP